MTYVFEEKTVELFFTVLHAHPVTGVDDPDQRICLFKVVAPVRSQGALTADVP